ncbi:hypothetical protein WISP_28535 [Willisornis vidua]|uniref:Uncharacterized protein n=1 Tax=Willisornis vidua TaxID=1566151 RepID=A0ABQ9DLI4_9PASS|nr:hypothetical protein WISP_28535 [Willisornis vidua]
MESSRLLEAPGRAWKGMVTLGGEIFYPCFGFPEVGIGSWHIISTIIIITISSSSTITITIITTITITIIIIIIKKKPQNPSMGKSGFIPLLPGSARTSKRCPEPGEESQVSRRAPEEQHKGIPALPARKSASLGPNFNAMGNKKLELESDSVPSVGGATQQGMSSPGGFEDNFFIQVIEEPRRSVTLDLVLTNMEGLVGNVKLKGSLGCGDHGIVEFQILREARRAHSKLITLGFRRAVWSLQGSAWQSPVG